MFAFWKIWPAFYSCYLLLIRPLALRQVNPIRKEEPHSFSSVEKQD